MLTNSLMITLQIVSRGFMKNNLLLCRNATLDSPKTNCVNIFYLHKGLLLVWTGIETSRLAEHFDQICREGDWR